MLTNIIAYLIALYLVLAFAAAVQVWVWDIPRWLDRSTAYGDGKLNWWERLSLLVWMPGCLIYTARHSKWPGVRESIPQFWVTIVLGRQFTSKDAM